MIDVKPIDWHNVRQVDFMPEHFTKFNLSVRITVNKNNDDLLKLYEWIETNCTGRFCITTEVTNNSPSLFIEQQYIIGFELKEDATMYSLFYK